MSLARQKNIRLFRKRMLHEANRHYRREVRTLLPAARAAQRLPHPDPPADPAEDLNQRLRRVRFDEDSNSVTEYAPWIADYRESEEEEESEESRENSSDEDFKVEE
jgi:hypothetical protein